VGKWEDMKRDEKRWKRRKIVKREIIGRKRK
jgi:hypothetical protein